MVAQASFPQFAKAFIRFEARQGQLIPFELNAAQVMLFEVLEQQRKAGRPIRICIVKGRQLGISTFFILYLAWRLFTTPGTRCMTLSHNLAAAHEFYRKLQKAWEYLPDILRPELEAGGEKGRRMLFADPLRGVARFDSAHEPEGVGRGMTLQHVLLSEPPQYARPEETAQAILATVSNHPDTSVFVESTAKGATGWFYELFTKSMLAKERGEEPEFEPVFIPWSVEPSYRRPQRPGEPDLSAFELEWMKQYELTPEQAFWYRDQRSQYGERVTEEYPSCWQEAFLSSGMSFFQREALAHYRETRREPLKRGRYRVKGRKGSFLKDFQGPTWVWADPVADHSYVLGLDFASGRAKDNSGIVVIDKDARAVVATHRSKMMPDDVLAEAVMLASVYNKALIVPERSGIGSAFVDRLVHEWNYHNVYREVDPVAVRHHKSARFGWATSNRTKQWLLEEMASVVHGKTLDIPDTRLVEEMGTFVYLDEEGKLAGAGESAFDDLVMALAFAIRGMTAMAPQQKFRDRERPQRQHRPTVSRRANF